MMSAFTYIIEAQNGLVKIGCSRKPAEHLHQVRLYSPVLARLVAMWSAPRGEELQLHARFDAHRSHKEWFRVEGALIAFLEGVWGLGVETIAEWKDLTFHDPSGRNRQSVEKSARAKANWADPEWAARWQVARRRSGTGLIA